MLWLSLKNGSNSRSLLNWRGRTPQEIPKEVFSTMVESSTAKWPWKEEIKAYIYIYIYRGKL
jgi:hypothetical protein